MHVLQRYSWLATFLCDFTEKIRRILHLALAFRHQDSCLKLDLATELFVSSNYILQKVDVFKYTLQTKVFSQTKIVFQLYYLDFQ